MRLARRVEPDVDPLDEHPSHQEIVIFEEEDPAGEDPALRQLEDVLDQVVADAGRVGAFL